MNRIDLRRKWKRNLIWRKAWKWTGILPRIRCFVEILISSIMSSAGSQGQKAEYLVGGGKYKLVRKMEADRSAIYIWESTLAMAKYVQKDDERSLFFLNTKLHKCHVLIFCILDRNISCNWAYVWITKKVSDEWRVHVRMSDTDWHSRVQWQT